MGGGPVEGFFPFSILLHSLIPYFSVPLSFSLFSSFFIFRSFSIFFPFFFFSFFFFFTTLTVVGDVGHLEPFAAVAFIGFELDPELPGKYCYVLAAKGTMVLTPLSGSLVCGPGHKQIVIQL